MKPYLWDREQRREFAKFTNPVTLYRGVGKEAGLQADGVTLAHASSCGISWTPFAGKAKEYAGASGFVLSATINRQRIKTLYALAHSKECVFLPVDAYNVVIVESSW